MRLFWQGILLILPFCSSVDASNVIWDSPTQISNNYDIITIGVTISAQYISGSEASPITVNSVVFEPFHLSKHSASTDGKVSIEGQFGFGNFGSKLGSFSKLSPEYQLLLATPSYGNGAHTEGSLTLHDLVIGHTYKIQIFSSDSRCGTGPGVTTFKEGDSATVKSRPTRDTSDGVLGEYIIGTFTAESSTKSISFISAWGEINALQLRDISVPHKP